MRRTMGMSSRRMRSLRSLQALQVALLIALHVSRLPCSGFVVQKHRQHYLNYCTPAPHQSSSSFGVRGTTPSLSPSARPASSDRRTRIRRQHGGAADGGSLFLSRGRTFLANNKNGIRTSSSSSLLLSSSRSSTDNGGSQNCNPNSQGRRRQRQQPKEEDSTRMEWLEQATGRLVTSPVGSLDKGKWHEVVSIFEGWSAFGGVSAAAPTRMEALLKRLLDERLVVPEIRVEISVYNRLLDAWSCAALHGTVDEVAAKPDRPPPSFTAAQRAREILVSLQEKYESTGDEAIRPNRQSFKLVLHAVRKAEGPFVARRVLAWMEYLVKSGKNPSARPARRDYILMLLAYANLQNNSNRSNNFSGGGGVSAVSGNNAGVLAEGFLRHMKANGVDLDTKVYNIAIKAWMKKGNRNRAEQQFRGREAAEHADRILAEMEAEPDLVTYSSVISAWAASGMRSHAVTRAEEVLEEAKNRGLEPNTVCYNAVMSAWVKSRNPKAANRTKELLTLMEGDKTCRPDLISYNTHLHALSMHSTKRPENAERADRILNQMEARFDSGEAEFGPNLFSYNLVIDAYCRSDQCLAAAAVLRKLIKRDQPDTFSFTTVLHALAKSSIDGASRLAEELLFYMEAAYKSGLHPKARPDAMSYSSVICAHSRSGQPKAAERAQALFNVMKKRAAAGERHLKPNRYCYNTLISAWGSSGMGTLGARRAEALLQEMLDARDPSIAPNIVSYNSVLRAWAKSGTRCCGHKAETYLNRMWELYKAGDKKVKPNEVSFNTVINAISKSKNEGKAQKALRILRRMDKLYRAGNKEARPNTMSYTSVLNSCAFPAVLDPRTRRKALDTAIFTLEELQSSRYGHANSVTYGTFILAAANLLEEDDDVLRRQLIERAFQQCCKDGQVGEMVLNHLRRAAPPDLYEELLADFVRSGARLSVTDLPLEWRRNVRDKDGWKKATTRNNQRGRRTPRHRKNEKGRQNPLLP